MVLEQEPAHVQREGAAEPRHLFFGNTNGTMSPWTQEAEDAGQALFLFERDFAAAA
jgi:hypothetical protein